MILLNLTIQGFRSYRKEQTFEFPRIPGLYFVHGRNDVSPELGPNGVGKSSLWDAAIWCITGKTARGVRGGTVANWSAKERCRVSLGFSLGGEAEEHLLTRTWRPNSLLLDGHPIQQEAIDALLGANFEVLTSSFVMGQFGSYFFDLTPSDKLALFSGLFDLDYWIACSGRARQAAQEADRDLHRAKEEAARVEGRLLELRRQVEAAKVDSERWEKEQARVREELSAQVEQAEEQLDRIRQQGEQAAKEHAEAEAGLEAARERLVAVDDSLRDSIQPRARDAERDHRDAASTLASAKDEVARVRSLGEGECPVCYSTVGRKHLDQVLERLEQAEAAKAEQVLRAAARARKAKQALESGLAERVTAERKFRDAEARLERTRSSLHQSRARWREADATLRAARKNLESTPVNPYLAAMESAQAGIRQAEAEAARHRQETTDAEKRLDRASYWQQAFKDLRLWEVDRVLLDLEVCVNNALMELGLAGWKITFNVERPTVAGGVSKGFSVFVESPESGGPAPWEAWSGGETQRLRLAGQLGLSDLIRGRRGFAVSAEVWDEPTQHLSREGVDDLLRLLKSRAQEQGRIVFLVDHVAPKGGEFDGVVTVVKSREGSTLVSQ